MVLARCSGPFQWVVNGVSSENLTSQRCGAIVLWTMGVSFEDNINNFYLNW